MFAWWRKRFAPKPAPLAGAPVVRRQKTYSSSGGYVYQYFYEGCRPLPDATEYVFDVSPDRRTSFAVSVFLESAAVDAWESARNRSLNGTERYAIAKMALFEAFDGAEGPAELRRGVRVGEMQIGLILAALDLD